MLKFSGNCVLDLNVNGVNVSLLAKPSYTLLRVLREQLGTYRSETGV